MQQFNGFMCEQMINFHKVDGVALSLSRQQRCCFVIVVRLDLERQESRNHKIKI